MTETILTSSKVHPPTKPDVLLDITKKKNIKKGCTSSLESFLGFFYSVAHLFHIVL
jgi:hypothetical protein